MCCDWGSRRIATGAVRALRIADTGTPGTQRSLFWVRDVENGDVCTGFTLWLMDTNDMPSLPTFGFIEVLSRVALGYGC